MKHLDKTPIVQLLCELIQIPSINPNLTQEKGHNEMQLAEFVRDWLMKRKIKASIEEVQPGRPNVYAEIGNEEGPTLCLYAHLDTVGVEGMIIPPFEAKIEGNRVYGRGSCDMKAGLAAVMCCAAAFAEKPVNGKLILALVCDEEYASIGADDYVLKHRAGACILTEPSDLNLVISHKGFLWGKITASGKSAHGSRWDLGESAISKMGPILVKLDEFDKNVLRQRKDHLVGPASMHVSLIQGGNGISTYAYECTIHLERRILPSEDIKNVENELEGVIYKSCPDAKIDWYFYRPPYYCDPNETIAKCVSNAFNKVTGEKVKTIGCGFWTDAAIFQNAGIPSVNIGPSGFGLHEPVEWVDADTVVQTTTILYQATLNYLKCDDCFAECLNEKESNGDINGS